jgi:hypothetical protein
MNDDFLTKHYRQPRPGFARALARRLAGPDRNATMHTRTLPRLALVGALALLLTFALLLAASPAARAQVAKIIRQVGGVTFAESARHPGGPESQVTVIPSEYLTLEQARAALPFEIALPEVTPEGYTLQDTVMVTRFPGGPVVAQLDWRKSQYDYALFLNINYREDGQPYSHIVGPQSTEEVLVNGQPAGLVRGAWNADTRTWDEGQHISLFWQRGDVTYALTTGSGAINPEELVRVAESIP